MREEGKNETEKNRLIAKNQEQINKTKEHLAKLDPSSSAVYPTKFNMIVLLLQKAYLSLTATSLNDDELLRHAKELYSTNAEFRALWDELKIRFPGGPPRWSDRRRLRQWDPYRNMLDMKSQKKNISDDKATEYGNINNQMVCPHCQVKGKVRTTVVSRDAGTRAGLAGFAFLGILAFGLRKIEKATRAHCDNCKNTWTL